MIRLKTDRITSKTSIPIDFYFEDIQNKNNSKKYLQISHYNIMTSLKKTSILIAFSFLLCIIAVVLTYRIASKNYEPIIDTKYYEKGLDYQKIKNMDQKSIEEGWQVQADFLNQSTLSLKQTVTVQVLNRNHLQAKVKASILLEHPASVLNKKKLP